MSGFGGKKAETNEQGGRERLAVSSLEALPSDQPVKYFTSFLENGGSSDMAVDGSGGDIVFQKVFGPDEVAFMEKLVIEIRDSGGSGLGDFGSGPALTNGLLLEVQIGGVIEISLNIKNNSQLITAADVLFEISQFQGSPLIVYDFVFRKPIALNQNDDGDFVRATVRDNLSGIQALQMAFKRWEVV